jgi:hypothetical protein
VRIHFNPAQVSYQQLLQVFFGVAHDPTALSRLTPRSRHLTARPRRGKGIRAVA